MVTVPIDTHRVDPVFRVIWANEVIFFGGTTTAMLDVVGDVDFAARFPRVYIGITVPKAIVALDVAEPTHTAVFSVGVRAIVFTATAMVWVTRQVGFTTRLIVLAIDVPVRALINDARPDFAMGRSGVRWSTRLIALAAVAGAAVRVRLTTIFCQLITITTPHRAGEFTALLAIVTRYAACGPAVT